MNEAEGPVGIVTYVDLLRCFLTRLQGVSRSWNAER